VRNVKRILVTRTDRLGDVLMSLPALVALQAALPEVAIDFLVRPQYAELLTPFLREREIRALAFDRQWPDRRCRRQPGTEHRCIQAARARIQYRRI